MILDPSKTEVDDSHLDCSPFLNIMTAPEAGSLSFFAYDAIL